jgi:Bacterial SH3 domain
MTLPSSIFDQFKEIDKLKESLLGNSYLKTLEQYKNQELLNLKQLQVGEIEKMKQNILANSSVKILEQYKKQDDQYQKLIKNSFALPQSTLLAINALNARNNIHADTLNSLFRPPKLADSVFESTASKLFKELSRSPLTDFNKLTYPENLTDLMLGKNIQDFKKRYKDSLKLFPSEISSALAISKMLGPVGIHAHYEEILKELKRQDDESSTNDKKASFSKEFILAILFSVLITLYQKYDSEQMEQRLNNKIDAKAQEVVVQSPEDHNELKEQIEKLELVIVNLSQTQQKPFTSAEYVVKDRSALIREEPRNGSKVIAHIFPNQVVIIIDSEGKWIEVTYYDWAKRNYMNGWVLKKYLQRVESN